MSSIRLPAKVLLPVAGKPMLAHQIDRLRKVRYADQVVVATSVDPKDNTIVDFCNAYQVAVFRGSLNDVLSRFAMATATYKADVVVRLTADCPLIDPVIIDHVISAYLESPEERLYVSNILDRVIGFGLNLLDDLGADYLAGSPSNNVCTHCLGTKAEA